MYMLHDWWMGLQGLFTVNWGHLSWWVVKHLWCVFRIFTLWKSQKRGSLFLLTIIANNYDGNNFFLAARSCSYNSGRKKDLELFLHSVIGSGYWVSPLYPSTLSGGRRPAYGSAGTAEKSKLEAHTPWSEYILLSPARKIFPGVFYRSAHPARLTFVSTASAVTVRSTIRRLREQVEGW